MKWRLTAIAAASLAAALTPVVHAQVGQFDERTEYAVLSGPESGNVHGPLLAVVLWRGEPGWEQPNSPAALAQIDSAFRWNRLRAEEAGQSIFGSGNWFGLLDEGSRALTVEGLRVPLAAGDSAYVVMVTVPPNGLPRIVNVARISSELPEAYWPKHWQSADTTFFVRPNFEQSKAMLRGALTASPEVATFLR